MANDLDRLERLAMVGEACGCSAAVPTADLRALIAEVRVTRAALALVDDLSCCGGNDDEPREHTQDCSLRAKVIADAARATAARAAPPEEEGASIADALEALAHLDRSIRYDSISVRTIRSALKRAAAEGEAAREAWLALPDNCQVCHGAKGGVRGNEQIINGVTMCDYCDALRS